MHKLLLASLSLCILLSDTTYAMQGKKKERQKQQRNWSSEPALTSKSIEPLQNETATNETELFHDCMPSVQAENMSQASQPASAPAEDVQISPAVETTSTEVYVETEAASESAGILHFGPVPAPEIIVQEACAQESSANLELVNATVHEPAVQEAQESEKETEKASISVERPISRITKALYWNSNRMIYALGLLENREGTGTEVGHQVDHAINYAHEQLAAIAATLKPESLGSIEAVEAIINKQKPLIDNLRLLITLTQKNGIQALEKNLTLAGRTIKAHDKLRKLRSYLSCNEDRNELMENKKTRRIILALKHDKTEFKSEISDDEYDGFVDLFDAIASKHYEKKSVEK